MTYKSADNDIKVCTPTSGDLEYDAIHLCAERADIIPDPLETAVVNAAIRLYAVCLPLQSSRIQEGLVEQLSTFYASAAGGQNSLKQTAAAINVATALLFSLQVAAKETPFVPGTLRSPGVEKALQELLRVCAQLFMRIFAYFLQGLHYPSRSRCPKSWGGSPGQTLQKCANGIQLKRDLLSCRHNYCQP